MAWGLLHSVANENGSIIWGKSLSPVQDISLSPSLFYSDFLLFLTYRISDGIIYFNINE